MTGLSALALSIHETDPAEPDAMRLIDALSDRLADITGDNGRSSFDPDDVRGDGACFVVARDSLGEAVGCGAYRYLSEGVAEIKRMFALPGSKGVGAAMLRHLEESAKSKGYAQCWLETRHVNAKAVNFYLKHGYTVIDNFGKYIGRPEAVCFGKNL